MKSSLFSLGIYFLKSVNSKIDDNFPLFLSYNLSISIIASGFFFKTLSFITLSKFSGVKCILTSNLSITLFISSSVFKYCSVNCSNLFCEDTAIQSFPLPFLANVVSMACKYPITSGFAEIYCPISSMITTIYFCPFCLSVL